MSSQSVLKDMHGFLTFKGAFMTAAQKRIDGFTEASLSVTNTEEKVKKGRNFVSRSKFMSETLTHNYQSSLRQLLSLQATPDKRL